MGKRAIVKQIITEYRGDRARCFNGGDYHYGSDVYSDLWTGEVVAVVQWSSADFWSCPVCGAFHARDDIFCADAIEELWALVDSLNVVQVDRLGPEDMDEEDVGWIANIHTMM